jgi:putative ABC transport system substrate-binding protein
MNKRRKLLFVLGASALAAPLASFAQQQGKIWRVGVLGAGSPSGWMAMVDALRAGLRDLGYVEGKNIIIEYRWAEGKYERLPDLATELVGLKVDVIVSHATSGIGAAKKATATIPIVIASLGDPVASGFVTNLSRPGGNITGLSFFSREIAVKRIELLKEVMPRITRVALLTDRNMPPDFQTPMEIAAKSLKLALEFINVESFDELEGSIVAMAKSSIGGVVVYESPMLISNAKAVGAIATKHRIASIGFKDVAEGGGLIAYGADIPKMWHRSATFVDKILKGAKSGDLPIEQATTFELVINIKTAKALGIKIPNSILVRADKVIE